MRNADFGLRNGDQQKESRFDRLTAGEKAQWPNEPTALQVERGDGAGAGVAVCGVWLVRARLVCGTNQQGEAWALRSVNRCRWTCCSAESAKRQATGKVARSGLAVWQTARTVERRGNQRHDREGGLCFGSLQTCGFGNTLPDGRVSEIHSCKSLFRPFRDWLL